MTADLIAYDLVARGKYTEALDYLDEAIAGHIGDPLTLYNERGYVYVCLGDSQSALENFAAALEIEPKSNYALQCRAIIFFGAQRFDEALRDFNEISETNLLGNQYWDLGKQLFTKTKNYERALYFIERLCNFDRENYHHKMSKAWTLSKLLRHKEAILIYQSLIDNAENQYLVLNNLGFAYIMDGQFDLAYSYLKKGLDLRPKYAYLNSNISIVYFYKKQIDKALSHIAISIENGPSNSFAYFLRSKYLLASGDKTAAEVDVETAVKLGLNTDFPVEKTVLEKNLFAFL